MSKPKTRRCAWKVEEPIIGVVWRISFSEAYHVETGEKRRRLCRNSGRHDVGGKPYCGIHKKMAERRRRTA